MSEAGKGKRALPSPFRGSGHDTAATTTLTAAAAGDNDRNFYLFDDYTRKQHMYDNIMYNPRAPAPPAAKSTTDVNKTAPSLASTQLSSSSNSHSSPVGQGEGGANKATASAELPRLVAPDPPPHAYASDGTDSDGEDEDDGGRSRRHTARSPAVPGLAFPSLSSQRSREAALEKDVKTAGLPWWKLILIHPTYRAKLTEMATQIYRQEMLTLNEEPERLSSTAAAASTEASSKAGSTTVQNKAVLAQYVAVPHDAPFSLRHPVTIINHSTLAALRRAALGCLPPPKSEAERQQQVSGVEESFLRERREYLLATERQRMCDARDVLSGVTPLPDPVLHDAVCGPLTEKWRMMEQLSGVVGHGGRTSANANNTGGNGSVISSPGEGTLLSMSLKSAEEEERTCEEVEAQELFDFPPPPPTPRARAKGIKRKRTTQQQRQRAMEERARTERMQQARKRELQERKRITASPLMDTIGLQPRRAQMQRVLREQADIALDNRAASALMYQYSTAEERAEEERQRREDVAIACLDGRDTLYGLSYYWSCPLPPSGYIRLSPDPRQAMWPDDNKEEEKRGAAYRRRLEAEKLFQKVNARNKLLARMKQYGRIVNYSTMKRILGEDSSESDDDADGSGANSAESARRWALVARGERGAPLQPTYEGALNINIILPPPPEVVRPETPENEKKWRYRTAEEKQQEEAKRNQPKKKVRPVFLGCYRQSLLLIHYKVYCCALHEEARVRKDGPITRATVALGETTLERRGAEQQRLFSLSQRLARETEAAVERLSAAEVLKNVPVVPRPVLRVMESAPPLRRAQDSHSPDLTKVGPARCWVGLAATPGAEQTDSTLHTWRHLHSSYLARQAVRDVFNQLQRDSEGLLRRQAYVEFVLDLLNLFFPTHLQDVHVDIAEEEWTYRGCAENVNFDTFYEKFFSFPLIFLRNLNEVTLAEYVEVWTLVRVCLMESLPPPASSPTQSTTAAAPGARSASAQPSSTGEPSARRATSRDRTGTATTTAAATSASKGGDDFQQQQTQRAHTVHFEDNKGEGEGEETEETEEEKAARQAREAAEEAERKKKEEERALLLTAPKDLYNSNQLYKVEGDTLSMPSTQPAFVTRKHRLSLLTPLSGLTPEQVTQLYVTDYHHKEDYGLYQAIRAVLAEDDVVRNLPRSSQGRVARERGLRIAQRQAEDAAAAMRETMERAELLAEAAQREAEHRSNAIYRPTTPAASTNNRMEELSKIAAARNALIEMIESDRQRAMLLAGSVRYQQRHHRGQAEYAKARSTIECVASSWNLHMDDAYDLKPDTREIEDQLIEFVSGVPDDVFSHDQVSLRERYIVAETFKSERQKRPAKARRSPSGDADSAERPGDADGGRNAKAARKKMKASGSSSTQSDERVPSPPQFRPQSQQQQQQQQPSAMTVLERKRWQGRHLLPQSTRRMYEEAMTSRQYTEGGGRAVTSGDGNRPSANTSGVDSSANTGAGGVVLNPTLSYANGLYPLRALPGPEPPVIEDGFTVINSRYQSSQQRSPLAVAGGRRSRQSSLQSNLSLSSSDDSLMTSSVILTTTTAFGPTPFDIAAAKKKVKQRMLREKQSASSAAFSEEKMSSTLGLKEMLRSSLAPSASGSNTTTTAAAAAAAGAGAAATAGEKQSPEKRKARDATAKATITGKVTVLDSNKTAAPTPAWAQRKREEEERAMRRELNKTIPKAILRALDLDDDDPSSSEGFGRRSTLGLRRRSAGRTSPLIGLVGEGGGGGAAVPYTPRRFGRSRSSLSAQRSSYLHASRRGSSSLRSTGEESIEGGSGYANEDDDVIFTNFSSAQRRRSSAHSIVPPDKAGEYQLEPRRQPFTMSRLTAVAVRKRESSRERDTNAPDPHDRDLAIRLSAKRNRERHFQQMQKNSQHALLPDSAFPRKKTV